MFDDAKEISCLLSKLTLNIIHERIEFVRQADLKTVQIDDLKAALFEMLKAFGCFAKSIGENKPLFRAMKHKPNEGRFEGVGRIYPDPDRLVTLGRANREHHAIFYLSGDRVVALHEVKAQQGEVISVLKCMPLNNSAPMLVPIGIDDLLKMRNVKAGGGFPENAIRIEDMLEHHEENILKYRKIEEFLVAEFLKNVSGGNEHEYKTTVAIAELFFHFSTILAPIHGLAYPSIAGSWAHANIALLPDAFHNIYRPVSCQQIRIEGPLDNHGFSVDLAGITNGINADGKFEWPKSVN